MPEYTVEAIVEKRPWEGRNGTNVAYNMRLAGQDQIVEWSKAQDSPGPQLGEKIVGELGPGFKDKLKFTPEKKGYGGGGGKGDYATKEERAQDGAKRGMSAALDWAKDVVGPLQPWLERNAGKTEADYRAEIVRWANWRFKQAQAAKPEA